MAKATRQRAKLTPTPEGKAHPRKRTVVIADPGPAPEAPPAPPPPAVNRPSKMSDAIPKHVRAKLEAAFAEERLQSELFGSAGEKVTMTFVLNRPAVSDLRFLVEWFANRYAQGGKVNRSALVRLALRCLRFELDPEEYGITLELPGLTAAGESHPATTNGEG
jgi:hypothetical protein